MQEALQKLNKNEEYLQRISKLEAENIELRERLKAIERVLKLDKGKLTQLVPPWLCTYMGDAYMFSLGVFLHHVFLS